MANFEKVFRNENQIINGKASTKKQTKLESGEKNDCTVRSLSVTENISYSAAHKICKEHGRKNGSGMASPDVMSMLTKLGYNLIPADELVNPSNTRKCNYSTNSFIQSHIAHTDFNYYICSNNHAIGITNGNFSDKAVVGQKQIKFGFKKAI